MCFNKPMLFSKASKKTKIAEETGAPAPEMSTASESPAKPRGSRSSKLKKETSETGSARHRKSNNASVSTESPVIDSVGVMAPAGDVELGTRSTEISPPHEEIAKLAYSFWVSRGYRNGSPEQDWLRAEQELKIQP